jgi:hypothetical protein
MAKYSELDEEDQRRVNIEVAKFCTVGRELSSTRKTEH